MKIFSSTGELIVSYVNEFALKGRTTVKIEKKSELIEKYPWILMLGWYIVLQNRRGRASR
jgi:hypothetical protein